MTATMTFKNKYIATLKPTQKIQDRFCFIPDEVYLHQNDYDGRNFIALTLEGKDLFVSLRGKDYGLDFLHRFGIIGLPVVKVAS